MQSVVADDWGDVGTVDVVAVEMVVDDDNLAVLVVGLCVEVAAGIVAAAEEGVEMVGAVSAAVVVVVVVVEKQLVEAVEIDEISFSKDLKVGLEVLEAPN